MKQTHNIENKLVGSRGEREGERGNIGVGECEVQISYKDILYNMGNIATIL